VAALYRLIKNDDASLKELEKIPAEEATEVKA